MIKVQDIKTITNYGVLMTPALVVDGVVKVSRKNSKDRRDQRDGLNKEEGGTKNGRREMLVSTY